MTLTRQPRSNASYGSAEWHRNNAAEVNGRPQVLPLNKRTPWTIGELAAIRANRDSGMSRKAAIDAVLAARQK